uniref:Cholesterol 25-hydroxylase like 1, tandem duplicate 1 n=2 Tax=Latimeria chalumnae TaxID=7897 RepID=H3B4T9_LATCH
TSNVTIAFPSLHVSRPSDLTLQPFWDYIIFNYGFAVKSPFFPVFLAFSCFFFYSLPFGILDILGEKANFFYKYKIQKGKQADIQMMGLCMYQTIYNHLMFVFPAVIVNWFWMPPAPLPVIAPSLPDFLFGVLGSLLLFDFQYFIWHLLHHKIHWLYKNFHAIHHDYSAPFSWATQHLGGMELISVGLWNNTNPILLKCHPLITWTVALVGIWMSVEDHIGYDFPWGLNHIIPFGLCGGAPAHDMHHQKPHKNFAPFFTHWDIIFGTAITIE